MYTAANKAKTAMPSFMERQRNNLSLYYTAEMKQNLRNT
jgi:hypothetical protein